MKKVVVLGYFGYENNQIDGQTVKTRNIYSLLKNNREAYFEEVHFFDTQSFKKTKFDLLRMFALISKANIIYYLPAKNNLKYIFPFIFIICKISRIKINYIVIGGWLYDFLKNKPLHRWMLSKIYKIYPETEDLKNKLIQHYNYNNVIKLHNFRLVDCAFTKPVKTSQSVKMVFMARVHPLKGVGTIFKLAEELKKRRLKHVVIDIYGPIDKKYEDSFYLELKNHRGFVNYKGAVEPLHIPKTLNTYDLMLFPTQFYTEGFPGSILDAYMANLPVIATNWKYAHEIIDTGKSGVIVEFNNEKMFIDSTIKLIQNRDFLNLLTEGAREKAKKYSKENAWDILKHNI